MSRWEQIIANGWFFQVANECYKTRFNVEVRFHLAEWLELNEWILSVDPNNQENLGRILIFLRELSHRFEIQPKYLPPVDPNNTQALYSRYRIEEVYRQILNTLRTNMNLDFFKEIQLSLVEEMRVFNRLSAIARGSFQDPYDGNIITGNVGQLSEREFFNRLDQEMTEKIGNLKNCLTLREAQLSEVDATLLNLESSNVPDNLTNLCNIRRQLGELCSLFCQIKIESNGVCLRALDELKNFKDEQRFVALGKKQVRDIEKIDRFWCGATELLYSLAKSFRALAELCQRAGVNQYENMTNMLRQTQEMKDKMIESSLVIEVQPKPVIRFTTSFGRPVKLRVLQTGKNRSVTLKDQKLLYSDGAAKLSQNQEYAPSDVAGRAYYRSTCAPDVTASTVVYADLKVEKPKRTTKRNEGSVVEEKFYIVFELNVREDEKDYELSAVSIRLSITSHPNQECKAWSHIIWENAEETMRSHGTLNGAQSNGTSPGRTKEPSNVSWNSLIHSIDFKFQAFGRGLSQRNKDYLKKKIFRENIPPCEMVSFAQFAKDTFVKVDIELLDRTQDEKGNTHENFTFWGWLWACLELLNWKSDDSKVVDHSLKKLWEEGKIEGFMDEEDMKQSLWSAQNDGTFHIRFPERRPESIGTYVFDANGDFLKITYTIGDLEKLSLQDRILDNAYLTHLYPNIVKQESFQHSTSMMTAIKGYIPKRQLREYFPSAKTSVPINMNPGQDTPSPTSSHYSNNTQFTHSPYSDENQSSSGGNISRRGSDNSSSFSGNPPVSTNFDLFEMDTLPATNGMDFSYGLDNFGVEKLVDDGVSLSVLNL